MFCFTALAYNPKPHHHRAFLDHLVYLDHTHSIFSMALDLLLQWVFLHMQQSLYSSLREGVLSSTSYVLPCYLAQSHANTRWILIFKLWVAEVGERIPCKTTWRSLWILDLGLYCRPALSVCMMVSDLYPPEAELTGTPISDLMLLVIWSRGKGYHETCQKWARLTRTQFISFQPVEEAHSLSV